MSETPPQLTDTDEIVRRFNTLYCKQGGRTWLKTYWLGHPVVKCPLDLWIYQEIVFEKRPDVIVETGTAAGGSAHFLACMCDLVGNGRVITVDIKGTPYQEKWERPSHPRITYLTGRSVAPEILSSIRGSIGDSKTVMVILDSNHTKRYVLAELAEYAPLVSPGHYLVVEDTNINYWSDFGPGPAEAVEEFLPTDAGAQFEVDRSREKFMMSFNPGGYLLRR
jgi:cephalosporin hydroxylase